MVKKNNGFEKPKKKYGKYIICKNCKSKIYYETDEEKDNIIRIADKKLYQCNCGEDLIIN